jgi:hypothetical protein
LQHERQVIDHFAGFSCGQRLYAKYHHFLPR